jgi:tRNA pseudouridine38-40 synthase
MPVRNIKLRLSYDGSAFNGWQVQPRVRTVQGVLEDAIEKLLDERSPVVASGRTDTGVHALGQVAHVHIRSTIPVDGMQKGLNAILPDDVVVRAAEEVGLEFHARYMAKTKVYAYVMETGAHRNPFSMRYALQLDYPLDLTAMEEAARVILGEHDFSSFMGAGSSVKGTQREVTASMLIGKGERIYYVIEGSGFLRHMVRNIVGTLLLIGKGVLRPEDMEEILLARDRSQAGPTAPPQGLYLVGVRY